MRQMIDRQKDPGIQRIQGLKTFEDRFLQVITLTLRFHRRRRALLFRG